MLELLQWKDNLESPLELVPPVQAVLSALLSWHSEADAAGAGAAAAPAAPQAPLPGGTYAMQLALSALLRLVQRAQQQGAGTDAFDLSLAVRCAQAAPDAGLRNSALTLVGALAQAAPQAALSHVLEVVGVVGRSAAMQADTHSNKVRQLDSPGSALLTRWERTGLFGLGAGVLGRETFCQGATGRAKACCHVLIPACLLFL